MRKKFSDYIDSKIENMPFDYVDLNSGEIHRAIGGYPRTNHRMPICCEVMYEKMKGDDCVLSAPPKGKGASLTIRYFRRSQKD